MFRGIEYSSVLLGNYNSALNKLRTGYLSVAYVNITCLLSICCISQHHLSAIYLLHAEQEAGFTVHTELLPEFHQGDLFKLPKDKLSLWLNGTRDQKSATHLYSTAPVGKGFACCLAHLVSA